MDHDHEYEAKPLVLLLTILGLFCFLAAGCYLMYLSWQGQQAQQAALDLLPEAVSPISANEDTEPNNAPAYHVLQIPAIDLELPVNWEYSDEALKTTPCRYLGPYPGEYGNLVITGHDYLGGAHFGYLDQVEVGDAIYLYDLQDVRHTYTVYETAVIYPDEAAALDMYLGEHALTLMTCTDNGNRRLLVRCSPVDGIA